MPFDSIDDLKAYLPVARTAFETQVKHAAAQVTVTATRLSSALGEVSLDELKDAIIREFETLVRQ